MDGSRWSGGRDLLTRTVAPALVLWLLIVGAGLTLAGPLRALSLTEDDLNEALAADRSARWNLVTLWWSYLGNSQVVIALGLLAAGVVYLLTREWRLAVVPLLALVLQGIIFGTASNLVDRSRPAVERLDPSPPTTSFPSGHVSASTAVYTAIAVAALHVGRTWLRRTIVIVCCVPPLLVAFSRMYRGMHYLSDVTAGLINGMVCALLAYNWYRPQRRSSSAG